MNIIVGGKKAGVFSPSENEEPILDWVKSKNLRSNELVLYMAMSAKWNGGGSICFVSFHFILF